MRKIYVLVLTVALVLTLLAGCGGESAAPEVTPTPETAATPEPPSTAPDPTPVPTPEPTEVPTPEPKGEKNRMYELLTGVFDNYHAGVAGSSLTAAWYAASIVDWTAKNGTEAAEEGALAWDRGTETEFGESFREKLTLMYSTALALTGPYRGILSDCGFEGDWDYDARSVHAAFETVFDALDLETPVMLLVWYPNDDASALNAAAMEVVDLSTKTIGDALTDYAGIVAGAIEDQNWEGGELHVALSRDFWQQVCAQGTAGEYMLLGSLVNTLLDAYRTDRVILTVDGAVPETGHNIYDYPLERYDYDPGD